MSAASRRLTSSVLPPLASWRRERTKGVTAWPEMPCDSASASASATSAETSTSGSGGRATTSPVGRSSPQWVCAMRATPPTESARIGCRRPAFSRIEERHGVGAEADDRHAERLESLESRRHVEQRLHARADDDGGRAGQLRQVCGDVRSHSVAPVDAADAARGENGDGGQPAGGERRAYGSRPQLTSDDAGGEVPRADLARVRARGGDPLELLVVETHAKRPVHDGDGRRDCTSFAHALLALLPDGDSLARREAVGNDRRLQGDDRPPLGQRLPNLT